MVESFRRLRPTLGNALQTALAGLDSSDEKADAFLAEFLRSGTSKGEFAQELAGLLDDSIETQRLAIGAFSWVFSKTEGEELTEDSVPQYIRDALEFLGVINSPIVNEPD